VKRLLQEYGQNFGMGFVKCENSELRNIGKLDHSRRKNQLDFKGGFWNERTGGGLRKMKIRGEIEGINCGMGNGQGREKKCQCLKGDDKKGFKEKAEDKCKFWQLDITSTEKEKPGVK